MKFLVGGLLLVSAAVSSAGPMQFSQCLDSDGSGVAAAPEATCISATPTNNLLLGPLSPNTLTFSHSLNSAGFLSTDSIISATLVIDLVDDQGSGDGSEKMHVFIDFNGNGSFADAGEQVLNDATVVAFSCIGACNTALVNALTDGVLGIKVEAVPGMGGDRDFFFVDSMLTVNVERNTESPASVTPQNGQVPEPGMLTLFAAGCAGLWLTLRRRRSDAMKRAARAMS